MIILLSPSKTLDFNQKVALNQFTEPLFLKEATQLAQKLKHYDVFDIISTMKINPSLAEKTELQYKEWGEDSTEMRPAIAAFKGEAYHGLDAPSLNKETLDLAQNQLILLSGLYGILRPLDLIQPYRLDVSHTLDDLNLYQFWRKKVTQFIIDKYHQVGGPIICLASNEYIKMIDLKALPETPIYFDFKEKKDNRLKTIVLYLKRARGAMARYLLEYNVTQQNEIMNFDYLGYRFIEIQSNKKWLFVRDSVKNES
jgi:cytoplasmic iron level regulating protein YaaA (DUF328/UPF0246 family)